MTHPLRAKGVDWIALDGEVVLFDGEHLHHLDQTGAAVWTQLDGSRGLDDIATELSHRFGADRARVVLDVEDLVRVLRARGLVGG